MTHTLCSTVLHSPRLKYNRWTPVIVIPKVLDPNILNGNMIVLKVNTRSVVQTFSMDSNSDGLERISPPQINFIFHIKELKLPKQFLIWLVFSGKVHNGERETINNVLLDPRFLLLSSWNSLGCTFPSRKMYWGFPFFRKSIHQQVHLSSTTRKGLHATEFWKMQLRLIRVTAVLLSRFKAVGLCTLVPMQYWLAKPAQ